MTAREDFSNPAKHRFGTKATSTATSTVAGGVYRMVLLASGMPHGQLAEVGDRAGTVSMALDISSTASAPEAWMGPLCYFQQKFGFSLRLYADGRYELVQIAMNGSVDGTLATGTVASVAPGTPVRMRLDCTGGLDAATATGWVGRTRVGPADDVEPSDNILRSWAAHGFWAMTPNAPATIVVDNVVMTEVKR